MNFLHAFTLFFLLVFSGLKTSAQVGIGTTNPNAQLDIQSSSQALPSATDGILIPKINNFPAANPTAQQDGMMVFLTGSGAPAKGFYYWNNATSKWNSVGSKKIDDLSDARSDNDGTNDGSSLFFGVDAGASDNQSNNRNVGVGYNSLMSNNVGTYNTAVGHSALKSNISGNSNTAIGSESLKVSTGNYNTATGSQTLMANTNGSYNTANGFAALLSNTSGLFNSAVGYYALFKNTTGNYNTAMGNGALYNSTSGEKNIAIGTEALNKKISGNYNVANGVQTLNNNLYGSGNVAIGYQAGYNETGSNKLYIENSGSITPLIGGDFVNDRVGINRSINLLSNTLEVGGEASKAVPGEWLGNSDRRLKTNIQSLNGETALDLLSQLNGVSYEWNDESTGIPRPKGIQYGFIAQELMEVFPEKVTKDSQGYYQTAYGTYDAFFVQAIKELKKELSEKEIRIAHLESMLVELQEYKVENEDRGLEKRIEKLETLLTPAAVVED